MAKSYYGLSTATIDDSNANNLTGTGGGSALTQTAGTQTFNFNGFFMQLLARGGSTSALGALNPPNGRGFLLDDNSLAGLNFPSGNWQALLTLFTSDVNVTADVYVRFYRLNILGAVYTVIGQAVASGVVITPTGTAISPTLNGAGAFTFANGESLYADVWINQLSGGTGSTLTSIGVASSSSGVPGATGGLEIVTPFTAGAVNIQATSRVKLSQSAALINAVIASHKTKLDSLAQLQVLLGPPTIPPLPMPLISLNQPAYALATFYPPNNANDDNYGTFWRTVAVPSSGTPQWLVYDLSGVPAAQRANLLIEIINEQGGQYLDTGGAFASSLPTDYTIDANAAAGGTGAAPSNGWVNLVSITGNVHTTMEHSVLFSGYNWLRLQITRALGTNPNDDANVQVNVHDAHLGQMDNWCVLGDSITNEALLHPQLGGGAWGYGGALSQLVFEATAGAYYPAIIDGGNAGQTIAWAAPLMAGLLNGFTGGFVVLAFGTNDVNQNFPFTPGDSHVLAYYAALLTCIDAALALNNRVIVPYIPWGSNNGGNLGFNANLCNQYVDQHLPTDRPGVIRGPDFWSFFQANPGLIRDGIHPTFAEVNGYASGYEWMHMLYAAWMVTNIYQFSAAGLVTVADSATGSVIVSDLPA